MPEITKNEQPTEDLFTALMGHAAELEAQGSPAVDTDTEESEDQTSYVR